MRVKQVKDKVKQEVAIPEELSKFLKHVYELILAKDPLVTTQSDDLLQNDFIWGGLNYSSNIEYGFTYTPTQEKNNKWELGFTVDQLKDIYEGKIQNLTLYACQSCNNKFYSLNLTCKNCDWAESNE